MGGSANAQAVSALSDFTQLSLQGVSLGNPTSLDVGADGKLYVSQQNGLIVVLTVARSFASNNGVVTETWSVTDRADVTLVKNMPNHDDLGDYDPGTKNRQVTGLVTDVDTHGHVMLYVTSSDPRIGGGGGGKDKDLDTNSGVISRLQQQVDAGGNVVTDASGHPLWAKVDLVRGLPRSEENHAVNGLEIVPGSPRRLLVAVGGHTNAGTQGNNFAYTPEYFYSGSMIWVDLDALAALEASQGVSVYSTSGNPDQYYLFDLPTLDDPTRANLPGGGDLAGSGASTADVFGGHDGLNQAIFDPSGIVTIASVGFRNQYDVVVTTTGEAFTVDNGSNSGWGGVPVNASGSVIVDGDGDGLPDNGPAVYLANESGQVNKGDQLHRIFDDIASPPSTPFYGGHPNLYRAHGMAAGFYLYAAAENALGLEAGTPLQLDANNQLVAASAPVDLASAITNANLLTGLNGQGTPNVDPRQAMFLAPSRATGEQPNAPDGALYVWSPSTNGIDEYTASNGLRGWLITVAFNGSIYALDVAEGGGVQNVQVRNLTTKPLDVVTQGDADPYPGVILVAAYGADQIVILSPESGVGVVPDPNDRDADGLDDSYDPFCVDPHNGTRDVLDAGEVMTFTFANGPDDTPPNASPDLYDGTGGFFSGGAIGFTGIMTNRAGLPEALYDANNIIFGGAPGVLQIKSVENGTPSSDTQRNGFQIGFKPGSTLDSFSVETNVDIFHDEIGSIPSGDELSQGLFLGTGDQNSFVSVSMVRLANGSTGFEVQSQFAQDFVGPGPVTTTFVSVPDLAMAGALDAAVLGLDVDVATGVVTPWWKYTLGGTEAFGSGDAVALSGDALLALNGAFTLGDDQGNQISVGMAVGVLASRGGSTGTFAADFDDLTLRGRGSLQVGPLVAAVNAGSSSPHTDASGITYAADAFGAGNSYSTSAPIAGTSEDALYQTETWKAGGWTYEVPVSNGPYFVTLHWAEIWSGAFGPNLRVFDVQLEGTLALDDLDIFAEVGSQAAYATTHLVEVTDGALTIAAAPEVQNPKISAFAIFQAVPTDTTAPSASLATTEPAVGDDPLTVTVTFTDDQSLDPASVTIGDASFSGSGATIEVLDFAASVAPDGLSIAATWNVRPIGGWTGDTVTIDVPTGAALDRSGNGSPALQSTYTHVVESLVRAVNCGGPAFTDSLGVAFEADAFGNGNTFSTNAAIAGTTDDALYQTERWKSGGFTYQVPVANGDYSVDLYFAEIWTGAFQAGKRVFDVSVEGQLAIDGLDIVAQAGAPNAAYVVNVAATVTDGFLTLSTSPKVQNPKISAFVIRTAAPGPSVPPNAAAAFEHATSQSLVTTNDSSSGTGSAKLTITPGNSVQKSNFGNNAFMLSNTGDKRISAVFIDVTNALVPDVVFDADGTGGDSVAKNLTYNSGAASVAPVSINSYDWLWLPARGVSFAPTLAFDAADLSNIDNLFVDAVSNNSKPSPKAGGGFRGELLLFTDFDPGETVGFSGDMDPNSIAGLTKSSVDTGSNQVNAGKNFDAGGVSGAEMIGSTVTALFGDGTFATGTLASDGSQSGAVALIGEVGTTPGLTVNGVAPGGFGTYGATRPVISLTGIPGSSVRVSMMKAFDPVGNATTVASGAVSVDLLVSSRLEAQYPAFPVNNAVEFQHLVVTIPASGTVNLTASFNYDTISQPSDASSPFPGDDVLPIAYSAVVIDAGGEPLTAPSAPIRLVNQSGPVQSSP